MRFRILLSSLVLTVLSFFAGMIIVGQTSAQELGQINLAPSTQSAKAGQSFQVTVQINAGSNQVNAVQANVLYPADKLTVASINVNNSAFDIQAENTIDNGVVKIARGTVQPVSGTQLVAVINFQAKADISTSAIRVSDDSALIRSSDNKNIYSGSQNYYADQSVESTNGQSDSQTAVGMPGSSDTMTPEGEKSFFQKIIDWNNSLWDALINLFSSDKK